jgi:hypothetical protein
LEIQVIKKNEKGQEGSPVFLENLFGRISGASAGNRAFRLYLFACGKKDTASIPCADSPVRPARPLKPPPRFGAAALTGGR